MFLYEKICLFTATCSTKVQFFILNYYVYISGNDITVFSIITFNSYLKKQTTFQI
jgi:hypothetical protein